MDHKTILTAAGAILITVVAASSAMALNIGILDSPATDNVGEMEIRPVASSSVAPRLSSVTSPSFDGPAELPTTTTASVPPVTSTEPPPAPPGTGTPPTARPAVVPTKPPPAPVTTVPRPNAVVTTPSVTRSPGATTSVASDDRNGRTGSKDDRERVPRDGRADDD